MFVRRVRPLPLTTESPTTHYCTVQHHVPIDPYAERMPRADCSSNTIRDSISRVSPSLRGPRFAPALRHARRPCALTRGRPAVPRQPGTGRSRRTARRAALARVRPPRCAPCWQPNRWRGSKTAAAAAGREAEVCRRPRWHRRASHRKPPRHHRAGCRPPASTSACVKACPRRSHTPSTSSRRLLASQSSAYQVSER